LFVHFDTFLYFLMWIKNFVNTSAQAEYWWLRWGRRKHLSLKL
jgi:hypothetical protein